MKIRPLVMNDEARNKIKGLIATAKENPYSFERMKRVAEGVEKAVGDHYRIRLDFGYQVAYSIEQHPLKDGTGFSWVNHLSISVSNDNNVWPSPDACNWILTEFGMPNVEHCYMWLENDHDNHKPSAINFVSERKHSTK